MFGIEWVALAEVLKIVILTIGFFTGGAIVEAENDNIVTKSINYDVNTTKSKER